MGHRNGRWTITMQHLNEALDTISEYESDTLESIIEEAETAVKNLNGLLIWLDKNEELTKKDYFEHSHYIRNSLETQLDALASFIVKVRGEIDERSSEEGLEEHMRFECRQNNFV